MGHDSPWGCSTSITKQNPSLRKRAFDIIRDVYIPDSVKGTNRQKRGKGISRGQENIPPTKAALEQRIEPTTYQACIWSKALLPNPELPSPCHWGLMKEAAGWQPLWTNPSKGFTELLRTYPLWLQERVYWALQVQKRPPSSVLPFAYVQETARLRKDTDDHTILISL